LKSSEKSAEVESLKEKLVAMDKEKMELSQNLEKARSELNKQA